MTMHTVVLSLECNLCIIEICTRPHAILEAWYLESTGRFSSPKPIFHVHNLLFPIHSQPIATGSSTVIKECINLKGYGIIESGEFGFRIESTTTVDSCSNHPVVITNFQVGSCHLCLLQCCWNTSSSLTLQSEGARKYMNVDYCRANS